MKHIYSKTAFLGLFLILISNFKSFSTNVTGGIYSNTIWTVANSPYVVSDTVVVFSGASLTIEAGVVVQFNNNALLDLRGNLYAIGTAADSIIFTSSSSSPQAGVYQGIYIEDVTCTFSYCRFSYANTAITGLRGFNAPPLSHCLFNSDICGISNSDEINIDTCTFKYDTTGISQIAIEMNINGCQFSYNGAGISQSGGNLINSTFSHNDYGIREGIGSINTVVANCTFDSNKILGLRISDDTIRNCTITNNGIGIMSEECYLISNNISNNNIGIETVGDRTISCNNICNNTTYNIENMENTNVNISNNYWCLTDSASIQATIDDGHNNLSLGLLIFTPFNSGSCIVGDTSKHCKAAFTLYPDSVTPHLWYALNQSTGKLPISYTWSWGDGSSSTGNGGISHVYAAAGYYTICVSMTDDSACSSSFCDTSVYLSRMSQGNSIVTVDVLSSSATQVTNVPASGTSIVLYPNPVADKLLIKGSMPPNSSIEISNLLGQTLITQSANTPSNQTTVDVSNLEAGVYFVLLNSEQGRVIRKFVKE